MKLKELKKYFEFVYKKELQQKNKLQDEYMKISRITKLPKKELIRLKKEYKSNLGYIGKILPVKEEKIISLYKEEQLSKINLKITKIDNHLNQITSAINAINENKFTRGIYPNDKIVSLIIEYAVRNNIPAKETLILLIELFKLNPEIEEKTDPFYNIEKTILKLFDNDGTINPENSFKTAIFNINKLIELSNVDENKSNITVYIGLLSKELEIEFYDNHIITSKHMKDTLEKQKKAISKLKEYVCKTKVLKSCKSITKFEKLCIDAGLDKKTTGILITNMEDFNDKEKQQKELCELVKLSKQFLNEEDIKILIQAYEIANSNKKNPNIDIIGRAYKDVLSMCRYMSFEENKEDYQNQYEILFLKMNTLRALVKEYIDKNINYQSNFMFISDNNNIPHILNDIQNIPNELYNNVYELLDRLNKEEYHELYINEEIPIYYIDDSVITIFYTIKENKKVILKITNSSEKEIIYDYIHKNMIRIKDFLKEENNNQSYNLSGTQAKIIDIELNIENNHKKHSLVKHKTN